MLCKNCGNEVLEGKSLCPRCGCKLDVQELKSEKDPQTAISSRNETQQRNLFEKPKGYEFTPNRFFMKTWTVRGLLYYLFFMFTFAIISGLVPGIMMTLSRWEEADDRNSAYMGFLVVTPGKGGNGYEAQILFKQELDIFAKENVNYSFLIPKEMKEIFDEQIKMRRKKSGIPDVNNIFPMPDNPKSIMFNVEQKEEGKQYIEIDIDDGMMKYFSRYEAVDKQIFPKYYKVVNFIGLFIQGLPIAFIINCILWFAIARAYPIIKKKRQCKSVA